MRILFDNDVPWPLRKHLTGHEVLSAYHRGWHQKKNSELLNLAEADGFDLLVTCDASMRFQQQVIGRKIGVLALTQTNWPLIERHVLKIAEVDDSPHTMKSSEARFGLTAPLVQNRFRQRGHI